MSAQLTGQPLPSPKHELLSNSQKTGIESENVPLPLSSSQKLLFLPTHPNSSCHLDTVSEFLFFFQFPLHCCS
jgi:hypothetical protein